MVINDKNVCRVCKITLAETKALYYKINKLVMVPICNKCNEQSHIYDRYVSSYAYVKNLRGFKIWKNFTEKK